MKLFISGVARSGKDSLTKSFIDEFAKNGILAKRYAFADELKRQLDPLLLLNFGISAFTEDSEEKALIRPLLLAYGQMCRLIDPDYWVKIVAGKIKNSDEPHIATVSDCRYMNEFNFFSGQKELFYVTRIDNNGEPFPPIGKDEEKHCPELFCAADYSLIFEDFCNDSQKIATIGEQHFYTIFGEKLEELRTKFPL